MYKMIKKWGMAILGCACALGLSACGKTVNLNDYVVTEVDGCDGYGKVLVYFDDDAFEEDYSKMKLKGGTNEMFDAFYDSAADYVASEFISVSADESSGLSNGDSITIEWDCDADDIKQKTGYSVKYEDFEFTITGLEEVKTFDAFEGVTISYSGTAPVGKATVVTDGVDTKYQKLTYRLDKSDNLSNGDIVKVSVESDWGQDPEYFINNFGAMPENFEKEFVVEGLASYVSAVEQIPEDMMAKMDSHAQDKMKAYVAENWADAEGLKDMKLIGTYLLLKKEELTYEFRHNNALYLVYEITATNEECEEGFTYYYYTGYTNIIIMSDSTCSVNLSDTIVPEGQASYLFGKPNKVTGEAFFKGRFWYKGYEDLDSLFNKRVVAELDEFNYVSTVEE